MLKRFSKKIIVIGLITIGIITMLFIIYSNTSNLNKTWGGLQLSDTEDVIIYNNKKYTNYSEHFRTEMYGEKIGSIGGIGESRKLFYEIPGMDKNSWLSMKRQQLAYAFVYKEENELGISIEEFRPSAVEFNNNGEKYTDQDILSAVLKMIDANNSLNSLNQKWLLAKIQLNLVTSIEMYSNKYPGLIYIL